MAMILCTHTRTLSYFAPQPNYWFEVVVVKLYGYPGNDDETEGEKCRYIVNYCNMYILEVFGHAEWR
jgi:hypothetical protein